MTTQHDRTPLSPEQLVQARRVAKIARGLALPTLLATIAAAFLAVWTDRTIEWIATAFLLGVITAALLGLRSLAFDLIHNGEPKP